MSAFLKMVLSAGFAFVVIGGLIFATMVGEYKRAGEVDATFEQITLQQFVDGDYRNKHLFEVTEARPGHNCVPYYDDTSGKIIFSWVPLYSADAVEDDGTNVAVIAQVFDAPTHNEVKQALDNPSVRVQFWNEDTSFANQLLTHYPNLDLSRVKRVSINEDVPSQSSLLIWVVASGAAAAFGLVLWLFACFVWLRSFQLNRRSYDEQLKEAQEKPPGFQFEEEPWSNRFQWMSKLCFMATPVLIFGNLGIVMAQRAGALDPTIASYIFIITVPAFFLSGLVGFAIRSLNKPVLKIQKRLANEVPEFAMQAFEPNIRIFVEHGYTLLGFAEKRYLEHKFAAYMQSPDRKFCIEMNVKKGSKPTIGIQGLSSTGMLIVYSRAPIEFKIVGLKIGLPIYAQMSEMFTHEQIVSVMKQTSDQLAKRGECFVLIDPKKVFQLNHYEAVLADWWAFRRSQQFKRPTPVPTLSELLRHENGTHQFIYARRDDLENAFDEPLDVKNVFPTMAIGGLQTLSRNVSV